MPLGTLSEAQLGAEGLTLWRLTILFDSATGGWGEKSFHRFS